MTDQASTSTANRSHLLLVALAALIGTADRVHAQVPVDFANPFRQQADPKEIQKKKFEMRLNIRIDELKRVCDLTDEQVQQLQTGAKGTVARAMVEWKEQAKALQAQLGGAFAVVLPQRAGDEAEAEEEAEADPPIAGNVAQMMTQMMVGAISPERQRIWKNVVEKVLTEQQRTKLTAAMNARRAFRRHTKVQERVNELDEQLLLSREQRDEAVAIVDRVLGKTLEVAPPNLGRSVILYGDEAQLLPKHLERVLTPAQLATFEQAEKDAANPMNAAMQVGLGGRRRAMPSMGRGPSAAYLGATFPFGGLGFNNTRVVIHQVVPGGPADEAGLQTGDVIKEFDGKKVTTVPTFLSGFSGYKPGEKKEVVFERDGDEKTVTVELGKRE